MKYTEIVHWSHGHKLVLEKSDVPYICWGCKQLGFTPCYQCKSCDFHLHEECAHAKPSASHEFLKKCNFVFHHEPPTNSRICDACGDNIEGFRYEYTHVLRHSHHLHPCCLKLPRMLTSMSTGGSIHLSDDTKSACVWCKSRNVNQLTTGWCYVSSSGERFHIACFRQVLLEIWKKGRFGNNMLQGNFSASSGRELMMQPVGDAGQTAVVKHDGKRETMKIVCNIVWFVRIVVSAFFGDLTPIFFGPIMQMLNN